MGNHANHMKLGLFVRPVGHHVASWRHPDSHADAGVNFSAGSFDKSRFSSSVSKLERLHE